jgi:hypothetical protein
MVISVNPTHNLKASSPIAVSLLGDSKVRFVRFTQLENALSPIIVTLFGISIDVKLLQPKNVSLLIAIKLLGDSNSTDVKLEQPEKALSPIKITVFGISIDGKLMQP